MKQPSRTSMVRIATSVASSMGALMATKLVTDSWSPAVFAGSAVLLGQFSSHFGDIRLGGAVSKGRMAAVRNEKRIEEVNEKLVELEKKLDLLRVSANVKEITPAQYAGIAKKAVASAPNPAADPKNRRTGEPADNSLLDSVRRRINQPIMGDDAKAWVASRTGGEEFHATETIPSYRSSALPFTNEIPVAMVADEFTYHSFKDEFHALRLTPSNWRGIFEEYKPRVFFCESAWQGGPPNKNPWGGSVYASVRWPKENRAVLLEILDYCHKNRIPTVFWNKEDPTHFSDRINDFVRTSALFDYVFTTAAECVEGYKKYAGANYVGVLPFAVQPKIFNPLRTEDPSNIVNFAGTWYGMYPDRCAAQAQIMDQALDAGMDLVIFDRMKKSSNPIYRYPDRFVEYTRDPIPYEQTAAEYKRAKFGITMNTVTDSKTMFARRVFELAASGAVVLSNDALGVREFFGDSVIYADVETDRLKNLTEPEYRDLQRRALNVALGNTYTHRAEQILRTVGIDFQPHIQHPTMVIQVSTLDEFLQFQKVHDERLGSTRMLAVVDEFGEQSLEFKISEYKSPQTVVLNSAAIQRDEFRTRSFVDTPECVIWSNPFEVPDLEKLEELQLHRSYFDGQIRFAQAEGELYQISERVAESLTLIPTGSIKSALLGYQLSTYNI